jgi:predicted RNA-binding protein YlxR (DUF448 family)
MKKQVKKVPMTAKARTDTQPDAPPADNHVTGRERRCIVTRARADETELIRFVAAPDGAVVPDFDRRLPGRGAWVACDRKSVELATSRGHFSRALKSPVNASPDLPDLVERILTQRLLNSLGLARRGGGLVAGFEKVRASLGKGVVRVLVEAADGAADGRTRILARAAAGDIPRPWLIGCFSAEELSLALGLENVIHAAVLDGRHSAPVEAAARRLAGFRPLAPAAWAADGPAGEHDGGVWYAAGKDTGGQDAAPDSGAARRSTRRHPS